MIPTRMRTVAIAGVTASTVLLSGCTGAGGGHSTTDAGAAASGTCEGTPIKIAQASPSFVYLPLYVAEGAGYLEQEGLVPETIDLRSGSTAVAGAVSNSVDVALVAAGEVYGGRSEGAPVTAFAQVSDIGTNVIIKKAVLDRLGIGDNPTDEQKLAALAGLRVGVTGSGSGSDQLIRYLAGAAGLDPDNDMEIIAAGGASNSVAGFTGDRFDAIVVSSPLSDLAIQQGDGAYLFNLANNDYEPLANTLYVVAVASDQTIAHKRDALECFTTALAHAQRDIHADPAAAAKIAQPFLGDVDPALYDAAFQTNINSWPSTPVIDAAAAQEALDFQNQVMGGKLDQNVLDTAIDTSIATEATVAVPSPGAR